ncbi:conserved protein of unknown function [Modestobacter italicus]|uniref:Protein argonaute n=1 Tax=Modestobacter italicus (strain DSM 44449 / CECT 9708 / BC 501) TaxID=2732864 RepID=I4EUS9_MODI5|nr:hypothetical protein [Modestobacter marinus]CCH87142.1 conserved protein of unknown function [Modestobacter marinus]
MRLRVLAEPELEFGAGARHIDPRFGIAAYGPADRLTAGAPQEIRVGVVGLPSDTAGLLAWLDRCRTSIDAPSGKAERMLNLFPSFPGFSEGAAFYSTLSFQDRAVNHIRLRDLERLQDLTPADAASQAVELYLEQIHALVEDNWCNVIICCRPDLPEPPEGQVRQSGEVNFRDLLKARAMTFGRPIQVIKRTTWGDASKSPITGAKAAHGGRSVQDEATRAWNLHTALYYKAGGVPWRLRRQSADLSTCFVGVGFFRNTSGDNLETAVAQVFNQRGDGVVVRGGVAALGKDDLQPHLRSEDASDLLQSALQAFRREHKTLPARCVLHKTSSFDRAETEGFRAIADQVYLDTLDLVWVSRSESTRLFRAGANNPPLRGTLLELSRDHGVLYSVGTVPFYGAYPGPFIPAPLGLRVADSERPLEVIGEEILALTKMNWNRTQLDARDPITLRTSAQVGNVLRFVEPEAPVIGSYAYYM